MKQFITLLLMFFLIQSNSFCGLFTTSSCGEEITMKVPEKNLLNKVQNRNLKKNISKNSNVKNNTDIINKAYLEIEGKWFGYLINVESEEDKISVSFFIERDESKNAEIKLPEEDKEDEGLFHATAKCITNTKSLPLLISINSDNEVLSVKKFEAFYFGSLNDIGGRIELYYQDNQENSSTWENKSLELKDDILSNQYIADEYNKATKMWNIESLQHSLFKIDDSYFYILLDRKENKISNTDESNDEDLDFEQAGFCSVSENLCAEVWATDPGNDNYKTDCESEYNGNFSKESCSLENPMVNKWCSVSSSNDVSVSSKFKFIYTNSFTLEQAEENCYCSLKGSFCSIEEDSNLLSCGQLNPAYNTCE